MCPNHMPLLSCSQLLFDFIHPSLAEPPLLAQAPPVITTGIGQSLSIPCMLLDGVPLPERHWSKNGKPVGFPLGVIKHISQMDPLRVQFAEEFSFFF